MTDSATMLRRRLENAAGRVKDAAFYLMECGPSAQHAADRAGALADEVIQLVEQARAAEQAAEKEAP